MPCHAKVSSVGLKKKIEKWVRNFNNVKAKLPTSIPLAEGFITSIDLLVFVDASIAANCAAVCAVINQPNSVS